jgi:gamma-glutamyltranspeptidase/glutathione hydrolase
MLTMRPGAVATSRTPIAGRRGAVASGHPLSAQIGIEAIRRGGSAIDAAIAAAFASFVVEPRMCGVGGHGRMSLHIAARDLTIGIDHFVRAPRAATPDIYSAALARQPGGGAAGTIHDTGHLAVGIPGAVAGLWEAHRRFGSLAWRDLVGPAIDLARAGFAADGATTLSIAARAAEIRRFPGAASLLLPGGLPPVPPAPHAPGHRLDLSDLARTLARIADDGAAAIYRGDFAAALAQEMRSHGGLLDAADLSSYRPDVFVQSRHRYRGHGYVTCGDTILAECLNILEHFDLGEFAADSVAGCHVVAEALAQSFVDNFAHAGDPRHLATPLDGLASKAFAARQAAKLRFDQARVRPDPGDPWPDQPGDGARPPPDFPGTTQICALDGQGNAASLITSLGSAFGSLVVVPDTGVFLGNAMQWFDPRPGRANSVAPGVMPLYAAPVAIVFDGAAAAGVVAGSGGYRIQTAVLHAIINHLDRGMTPQCAIDAPRLHAQGDGLELDSRFDDPVVEGLRRLGHDPRLLDGSDSAGGFGRPSAVWRLPDGTLHPASDARAGGVAATD